MKTSPGRTLLAACALSLTLCGCSKKSDNSGTPAPPSATTATVSGLVASLSGGGLVLAGATVSSDPVASGASSATTNGLGQFTLTVPANVPVTVTATKTGYTAHAYNLQLATGESRGLSLSVLPFGVSQVVSASTGGKVTDTHSQDAVTLPPSYLTTVSAARVALTGIDPTTGQALGMPGGLAAKDLFNATGNLDPIALAEIRVDNGAGIDYALEQPVQLELKIPASRIGDVAPGSQVQCFRFDPTDGIWKAFAYGTRVTSSVDGQPAIKVAVDHLSWYAAAFVTPTTACVSGIVTSSGQAIPNVDVQAFPGGLTRSNALGQYEVDAPQNAPIQVVAIRVASGVITTAGSVIQSPASGGPCAQRDLALEGGGALSFIVEAQLIRGREEHGLLRDEAVARIRLVASPNPTPYDGANVQLLANGSTKTLPGLGTPGYYGLITGQSGVINLQRGFVYTLRIDFDNDGVFDATSQIMMPGAITVSAPTEDQIVDPSFVAKWFDDANSAFDYDARYLGSFEWLTFGTFPNQFVKESPALEATIGNGVGDPALHMSNDPLGSGQFTFRLWATSGPIRYALPDTTLFTEPNITGANVTGWFSAISMADSVTFGSIGPAQ
jgi:hypothetical protein